jgi:hypothetical protein
MTDVDHTADESEHACHTALTVPIRRRIRPTIIAGRRPA